MGILDAFRARHLFLALALSALVAGACAVVLLAGIPSTDDPRGAGGADETALPGQAPALRAVAARIADESRRAEPISPATGSAPRGSAHRPAPVGGVPMPPPPRGYSFVEHHGELAAAPIRLAVAAGPAADGPDWIGSPEAVALLVAQAAAASRDWSFGWIRLAEHARVDGLAAALRGTGAEIVGSAGRLVRARLPADPARLEAIAALPEVDGLGGVPSRTKLRMGRDDIAEIGSDATRPVFVTLMADDVDGRQRRALEARGAVVGSYDPVLRTYRANAGAQVLQALAAMDVVLAVEPVGLVAAAHDTAVPAMGADALRAYDGAGIFSGTGGASVPVGILDTGLNVGHHDIASHRDSICGANFVFRGGRDPQADLWYDHPGHGTHVAGTLLGNGIVERRFAGMAPSVRHIRVAKVLNEHSQGDADSVVRGMDYLAEGGCGEAADATGQAPLIVNASLRATGDSAGRGTPERKIDAMVWTNRQLYVVGQGNAGDGGHSAFAAAKNSLAVGAVLDSGELAAFSSRGPTADGRLAPNVVANGVGVRSAAGAGSVSGYERRHGSSMASASAAGAAALLMDALPVHRGRPALTRARLMASAIRPDAWLDDAAAFPLDNSNGPGTLQAGYGMGKASARSSILDRDGADGWTSGSAGVRLGDGEYASHEIVVPDGTHRLDLVLTWDEPPAEVVAPSVHSDLDLWLDSGDDCGGAACGEHSSLSRIDNVEWIIVRNPPPGTYAAKVVASRVYGAEPRAALAWTAIRGKSTPALAVAADRTVLEAAGRHDLTLTVTADAYLASGARLHVDCHDPTGGTGCDQVTFDSVAVAREDSVALTKELDIPCTGRDCAVDSISFGASIPLGEIAAGESQEVRLGVAVGGEASARLRFAASAWNAEAGSVTVGVGTDAGAQAGPAPPANDGFDAAAVIEGESGTRELNLHAAGTEPGEPDFGVPPAATLGNQAFPGRPAGSAWYRWTAPATGAFHFRVAAPDAPADDRADRVEAYVGDTIAGLERVGSGGWSASVFAEQGTTYRIRVGNLLRGVPTQLHWSRQPRPANDDFAAAAVLEGAAGRVDGTSVGATLEAGETLGEAAATTWYRWTAPDDGDWNFWVFNPPSVEGPLLRRVLVFEAESIASRRLVSKRPDATVGFRARRGTEYRIAVANDDASVPTGEYTLYWRLNTAPRTGDTFALAESIAGDASGMHFVQVDRDSRVEPGEPEETGIRTSWWVWEAPGDDVYTWRIVTPPGEERVLRVVALTGEGEPGLTDLEALAHADAFASPSFRLEATGGQRYWLAAGFPAQSHAGYTNARAEADLDWGPAPGNDDAAGARALAGASGSFAGSNRHATKASGAKSETLGDSTVWWTYEAPGAGWVRFAVAETGPWVLTVHRDGVDGGLEVLASSRWQAPGRLDGDADTSEVLFNAAPGVRYTISLGVRPGAAGTDFTLEWSGAEAPGWLRYAGRLVDGDRNAADVPVELRGPAGLAVHASGSPLYLASSIGLQVFERDAATGDLDFLQLLDGNLGRSSLHWDSHRDRLLAEDCGDWRVFAPAADDAQLEDRGELQVADEPGRCGAMLVMASDGAFVYRIGDGHVDLYSVDDAGSLGFVDAYEAPGVRSAVLDDRRDRVYAVAGDSLLVFDREGETGRLTRRDEAPALETARALALADDGDHLFVLDARGERTLVYALGEQAPRRLAEAPRFWLGADPDNECRFAALRGTDMIDAFCRSAAFRARWNPDDETVGGTDYIAHGLPDRYGNPLPDFDFPTAMVAAPDGRHVYLSTPHEGLLIFAGPDAADVDGDGDPDLAIQSQWAGDSGPFAGSRFTLGAVVRNRGDGASPATTIRAYRSDDAEISAADSEVGSVGFVGLDAGATRGQSIAVAAPATPGTYRYGLCVDAVEGESDTSNNCSAAVTIDVVAETRFPDLVVRSPAVSTDQPEPGASFTLSAIVLNRGEADADATTLRYYRSTDAAIGTDDTEVGSDAVDGLAVSASRSASIDLEAPSESGMYYYGACVDAVAREGDTANNCSDAVAVTVAGPDLAVASLTASNAAPAPDETFTLEAEVSNLGARQSSATQLRFYRSDDDQISTQDVEVGLQAFNPLPAGATRTQFLDVQAPSDPGTYYYGACVDAESGETDTGNNCSAAATVTVAGVEAACMVSVPDDRGSREITFDTAALVDTSVGTADAPVVQTGAIDAEDDVDTFRIVLDSAMRLKIRAEDDGSDNALDDTQAGLVSADGDNCARAGNTWQDAEWAEGQDAGDYHFYSVGNLAAGTYYLAVTGFGGETGDYSLELSAEDQPGNTAPDLSELQFGDILVGEESSQTLTVRDSDDGDWIVSVSAQSADPSVATVAVGELEYKDANLDDREVYAYTGVFVDGLAAGTTTVTVTAEDQRGESASQTFEVTVVESVASSCEVYLWRGINPRNVEIDPAELVDTSVGTAGEPHVQNGNIAAAGDFEAFRIVLDSAVQLKIKADGLADSETPHSDTQAGIAKDEEVGCSWAGNVWQDAGWREEFENRDWNFYLVGNLAAGTYFLTVGGWQTSTGEYSLELWAEDQPDDNAPPVLPDLDFGDVGVGAEVTRTIEVRDNDDGDWVVDVEVESADESVATVRTGALLRQGTGAGIWVEKQITVEGVAEGTTTITVTTEDQRGESASRDYEVTVAP